MSHFISNKAPIIKPLLFIPRLITKQHESIIAGSLRSVGDITKSHYSAELVAMIRIFQQEVKERHDGLPSVIKRNATYPTNHLGIFCEKFLYRDALLDIS